MLFFGALISGSARTPAANEPIMRSALQSQHRKLVVHANSA
jgi:hypothetical protein